MDSETRKKNSLDVIERKLKNGEWISIAPYGYTYADVDTGDDRSAKVMITHPEYSHLVTNMFELYATGAYSVFSLAQKMKKENGFTMARSSLTSLLKNPFYAGIMKVNGLEYPHRYEKLVSMELFNSVQKKICRVIKPKMIETKSTEMLYRGLFRCAECGASITPELKKEKYIYYHCGFYKGRHPFKYIQEPVITNILNQKIIELVHSSVIQDMIKYSSVTTLSIILRSIFDVYLLDGKGNFILEFNKIHISDPIKALELLRRKIAYNQADTKSSGKPLESADFIKESELDTDILSLFKIPISIDELIEKTGRDLSDLQSVVFDLHLSGKIEDMGGGKYQRVS